MTRARLKARPATPRQPTVTEAQSEDDARQDAERQRIAARQAFRYVMLRAHGCTGEDCGAPVHDAHLGRLLDCLMAMGLIEDPAAKTRYHWGHK